MKKSSILLFITCSSFLFVNGNRTNKNLNLQQLQNRCLSYQSTAVKSSTCITQKKLKMQITRGVENGVFYCLTYEKTTGNVYGFDSLTIELHPDYDLQYSGANVIDYEFPSFKLYDVRVTEEYKGRFAIYSNNTSFKIYQVTINNEPQNCTYGKGKNRHMWPEQQKEISGEEITTLISNISTTTSKFDLLTSKIPTTESKNNIEYFTIETTVNNFKSTTFIPSATTEILLTTEIQKDHDYTTETIPFTTSLEIEEKGDQECGGSSKLFDFKQFQIPYNPGEFPFAVSIFRIMNSNETHYKCAGTIISSKLVISSVNCLLDHNSRLLNKRELIVYTAQYSLLFKKLIEDSKVYKVEEIFLHEKYNYNLENNIAVVKVERTIAFDDLTQPVCLPDLSSKIKNGNILKLVGFGQSNLLTENDFQVKLDNICEEAFSSCEMFSANSTTINYIDLGCGLYNIDERNRWKLIGIASFIPHHLDGNKNVIFTNVFFYNDWLNNIF